MSQKKSPVSYFGGRVILFKESFYAIRHLLPHLEVRLEALDWNNRYNIREYDYTIVFPYGGRKWCLRQSTCDKRGEELQ